MDARQRQDLDRHITGNYGEDSVPKVIDCDRCGEQVYEDQIYIVPGLELTVCLTCYIEMGGKV